jgi:hypothetical protein
MNEFYKKIYCGQPAAFFKAAPLQPEDSRPDSF